MNIQKLAWLFAIVFILIGILGFVPGITVNGHLLGIFEVGPLHNIIHLATGIVAAIAAGSSDDASRLYFKVFGVVYALVTVVGFVQGTNVLGIFNVNMADNVLHLAIALIALWIGFGMKGEEDRAEMAGDSASMSASQGPGPGTM